VLIVSGNLLMFWTDDRYKSTLYRERTPSDPVVDYYGDCYSLAYFNQPSRDCVIQGPLCKYPSTAAGELMDLARKRNFAELETKKQRQLQMTFAETIAASAADPNVHAGTASAAFEASMSSNMGSSCM